MREVKLQKCNQNLKFLKGGVKVMDGHFKLKYSQNSMMVI